jgi:hypothetical protein
MPSQKILGPKFFMMFSSTPTFETSFFERERRRVQPFMEGITDFKPIVHAATGAR